MREANIDIFSPTILENVNAICFTSNGIVRRDGKLVMGAGVAKAFRDRLPGLDAKAGLAVRKSGNVCQIISTPIIKIEKKNISVPVNVVAFPTKNHFKDDSDIDLIMRSSRRLMELIEEHKWQYVALPRPGCQNGNLSWNFVREKIEKVLDKRVIIVYT
jgi:hypothetical protein